MILFAFWVFDKAPPKFNSRSKPEDQQFDTSAAAPKQDDKDATRKRILSSNESDALAKAVASLAPTEEEQKKKFSC